MILVKLDVLDGAATIEVAVSDYAEVDRLRKFMKEATKAIEDAYANQMDEFARKNGI